MSRQCQALLSVACFSQLSGMRAYGAQLLSGPLCVQASLQTLLAAQGQAPGFYGGQPMQMAGLGGQLQQQQSVAMMRLMQLSAQSVPGYSMQLRPPQGQLMPGSGTAAAQPGVPPPAQTMDLHPQTPN